MAVNIDTQAFRDSLPTGVYEAASRLRSSGNVDDLERTGGGVQAVVRDGDCVHQPWVGVVERAFIGECDCTSPRHDDLCVHAVAVALAAFECDIRWAAAATPPGAVAVAPEHDLYLSAMRRLAPRQLTALVVEQAAQDRLFAATLLRKAGMLDEPDHGVLDDFRRFLRHIANVANSDSWEISDVEAAGRELVAEVEILCIRPATFDMLDLVEQAIDVWDDLCGHLIEGYDVRRTEPEEITEPLVESHRHLCERLGLGPAELSARLADLVDRCGNGTLDINRYADLVG